MEKKALILKTVSGAASIFLALYFLYASFTIMPETDRWWKENSIRTSGLVLRLRETYRNKAYCHYPVIEFTAENGKKYSFSPYDCSSRDAYRIGQQVAIRYSRKDPASAYIDSETHDRATYIAVYFLCGIMATAGVLLIASAIKTHEKRSA